MPRERYLAIFYFQDAVIADGYSVGISAEVFKDTLVSESVHKTFIQKFATTSFP